MDSDSRTRFSSYSRRYRSRSDVYHGEEYEGEEEQKPEYLCSFCTKDFDMVGLCCHIDEEHAIDAKNRVCPVCAKKVGSDFIRHLTVQHGSLLKLSFLKILNAMRRRRLHQGGLNFPFSIFRKELRDGNLHSLLGGGSSLLVSSSHTESDLLLTSFIYSPHVVDDESSTDQSLYSVEACSMNVNPVKNLADKYEEKITQKSHLFDEDLKEKAQRCEFVQGLLLSTSLDDNL